MQEVGSYEVLRVLARGGMAVVYLARQPRLNREVALKRLELDSDDPTLVQRFVREAQLAAGLDHPNIVTLFDFFEDDGVAYIAMEYVRGGTLRSLVGRLDLPQVLGVLEGILAGLVHAEERGIAHRDLKPENVLITLGGNVKIADFGIARAYNALTASLTASDAAIGTPSYMAPEQVRNEALGPYTDIYAVGVIAYELLAGRPPFEPDHGPLSVLYSHVHTPPEPLVEVAPDVPRALCEWVEWLLAKAPADRPASAAMASQALEEIAVTELGPYWRRKAAITPDPGTLPTLVADAPPETPTTKASRRRRLRLRGGTVAVGLIAAVAGVTYVLLDSPADERAPTSRATKAPKLDPAMAYDFDGDGRRELVLGMAGSGQSGAGAVVVIHPDRTEVIRPADARLPSPYNGDENFGRSIASGDFNGDGRADLAASAPGRDLVTVISGTPQGPRGDVKRIRASEFRIERGEGRYGSRLLAVDMNHDGFDDIVAGAPAADTGPAGSGVVQIIYGGPDGVGDDTRPLLRPDESLSRFGSALRAGDINGDDRIDLVEGAPDDPITGRAGHATYCRGTPSGLPECTPLTGPVSSGTSSLAVADVNGDGYDDIAQGDHVVEPAALGRAAAGGEVRLWLGSPAGPAADPIVIDQRTPSIPGLDEAGDDFGLAIGAADLDRDRYADIVIGAPGENSDAGAVTIVRGGRSGHAQAANTAFARGNGIPGAPVPGERFGAAVGVMDIAGNERPEVIVTAGAAADLGDAVFVIQPHRGAFAPGETDVWQPLQRPVALKDPDIANIRIARGPKT